MAVTPPGWHLYQSLPKLIFSATKYVRQRHRRSMVWATPPQRALKSGTTLPEITAMATRDSMQVI
jgi:hypothetical protein